MSNTKHKFSSFAAPTPEDIAVFETLSEAEQKDMIEAELARGFTGQTKPLTQELMADIRARALARLAEKNAQPTH